MPYRELLLRYGIVVYINTGDDNLVRRDLTIVFLVHGDLQPTEQREQRLSLLTLCRVVTEEDN